MFGPELVTAFDEDAFGRLLKTTDESRAVGTQMTDSNEREKSLPPVVLNEWAARESFCQARANCASEGRG